MKLRRIVLVLLLAACANETHRAPEPPPKRIILPPPSDAEERGSAIDIARGSCVVSRTGEALLNMSAINAIDGDPSTHWANPPGDLPQSMVISLPAKTRIEAIGIRSNRKSPFAAQRVAFEASNDGRSFAPLGEVVFTASEKDVQWTRVAPTEATYIRVTMEKEQHDVRLQSVLARGRELEPPREPKFDGCWIVNGRQAELDVTAARVTGLIAYPHDYLTLDGGSDGRIARFEWIRGNEFGYAVISASADGQHVSGVQWHEEPIPLFFGESWYGDRAKCPARFPFPNDVATRFLRHTGRHSLYALRFRDDGSLDVEASRPGLADLARLIAGKKVRLVAHEFREADANRNRQRAQRELDSLKAQLTPDELAGVTFIAAGSDDARQIPASEAARELYSTVDLEVGR